DFGLAKLAGRTKLTRSGTTMGTVAYMSPEQTQGTEVDHRTDIWALAAVLYEMVTGQNPFQGDYEQAVMYSIMNEEPEPMTGLRTGVPMELERIVDKALAKNPNERYQHVDEMRVDLKSVEKRLETGTPKQALVRAKPGARRRKFLYSAIVFFVLLVSGTATYFQLLREKDSDEGIAPGQRTETSSSSQWQNSIAVLPFKNISPDPEQEYFCDGMTEQIITNLSQLQNLKVIARTSVMKFKKTEKIVPEIAAELGVAHILEGSIRKVGNRIRVTAQLIQADEGHHLWAQDYDRELEDIFAVQDDVSEAIARALLKKFTIKEAEQVKTKGTKNVEAYEYNLKGVYFHVTKFLRASKTEYFRKSESMFKKAIELDPNYALAYANLADLYNTYFNFTKSEEEKKKYLDLQQNFIEIAFRLDPNSAGVNMAKGYVHKAKGETDKAYESFKRALEIDPNESEYYSIMGNFLRGKSLLHQAINYLTKAIKLNPLDPSYYHNRGIIHRELGNVDQSIIDYQNARELAPDSRGIVNGLAKSLMIEKKYSEAEELLIKAEKLIPGHPDTKKTRALLYAALGKKDEALELLKDNGLNTKYNKMAVYCLLGLKDEAIKLIDNEPWAGYLVMLHHPYFEILRDTDEFKAALQKAKEIYEEDLKKYQEVFL
ncbi:MAG: tetratricopeptide repeat protein, partial [bacterium]